MAVSVSGVGRGGLWRSRWAAIGAAVAVTLGGGGLVAVNAASSPASSVVTIDPVRILDTRTNVGLSGPFSSGVSRKLQVTGAAVPAGATGVLLNVTVVNPSAAGFLSVRPGDATGAPSTSSLNFDARDIIPNAVQVGLPTTGGNAGQIEITFDAYGAAGPTSDVLVDVVGYTTDTKLKALEAGLATKANSADVPRTLAIGRTASANSVILFGDAKLERLAVGDYKLTINNAGPVGCPAGPGFPDLENIALIANGPAEFSLLVDSASPDCSTGELMLSLAQWDDAPSDRPSFDFVLYGPSK